MESSSIVYFIRASDDGPVKIGVTRDLSQRLDTLQAMAHEPLVVIRSIHGSIRTERWLHREFADRRLHREWFRFHSDMLTVEPPSEDDLLANDIAAPVDRTYAAVVVSFIRQKYLPLRRATVTLAADAGTTPRTAENWLAGTHAPNGEKLINLLAANSDLHEEINRLIAERKAARGES